MIDHSIDETINMLFESDSHQEVCVFFCEALNFMCTHFYNNGNKLAGSEFLA